jgi:hypothetical protein
MGCWLERQAAAQIEYLKAENRLLRSRLGRRRIVFTDAERSTLATLAKEIGTRALRALYHRVGALPFGADNDDERAGSEDDFGHAS